jgi:hypothetical protein
MSGGETDRKIYGSGLTRIPFGTNEYTFMSDIGDEHRGRVIDHILTRGHVCSALVSKNGRFLNDHIPIIAKVEVNGICREQGRRLNNITVPNIRPGDGGARRRLLKEFDKIVSAGLEGWTHDQIVVWTANKAKEIARSRNKKDNPDG